MSLLGLLSLLGSLGFLNVVFRTSNEGSMAGGRNLALYKKAISHFTFSRQLTSTFTIPCSAFDIRGLK